MIAFSTLAFKVENIQGPHEVAGQAFIVLSSKRMKILKKCIKYLSKIYILASKVISDILMSVETVRCQSSFYASQEHLKHRDHNQHKKDCADFAFMIKDFKISSKIIQMISLSVMKRSFWEIFTYWTWSHTHFCQLKIFSTFE